VRVGKPMRMNIQSPFNLTKAAAGVPVPPAA